MARKSKEEIHADVHQEALLRFSRIQSALRDERLQCLQDRRFYSVTGAQWEGPLGDQFENRPRYEFNKVHLAVIRIFNEYRNNRISVAFSSKDGARNDKLSDTCAGLYRADERFSNADEAIDNAFEEGVGGGFGAWRLRAVYEDDEDDERDEQRIAFEPIVDADSCVYFDLNSKRYDKADAKYCFVLVGMTRDAYKEEFGDDPASWPKTVHQREFDWQTPDVVYVAEYYCIEEVPETILIYKSLFDGTEKKVKKSEIDEDQQQVDVLRATGFRLAREKKIKRKRVHKYLMSGGKILEDCGLIPGSCLPIIPYYGKRWFVDNVERCMGHVRLAKDAQRLTNSLMSWLAEMANRFDIEKPILTPEQIAGHATMWAEDNISKYPYLLVNPIIDANGQMTVSGPVAYTKAPNIPPAMAALVQIAEQGLQDLLGNQQAGEEMQSNISGKVVELIQNRLDMQVFIYMSNLAKSVKRCGEVWLSMMRDIVTEENRTMKTIDLQGKSGQAVLNRPMYDEEDGEEYLENDLSEATFDVDVDVGPSSTSRRAATVRSLTALAAITDDPQTKQALVLGIIENMEGEGLQDLRDWARANAIKLGTVKPTEEEMQELQQEAQSAQPDPQTQYLQAAASHELASADKKRADIVDTVASADLKHAQAQKLLVEMRGMNVDALINAAEAIRRVAIPHEGMSPLDMQPPPALPA